MGAVAAGLVAGTIADHLLGDPSRLHPVAGFGHLARLLERFMWRPRRASGALYTAVLVGATAASAAFVDTRLRGRPRSRAGFVALALWSALGGRSLRRAGLAVADCVRRGDIDEARRLIPALAGRDPSRLDGPELCRAAVESIAENTADAVVGPLWWGAVAGPAGIVAYRAANTLDAMVGHRSSRYERFGWAAARTDDALTWPAARLAVLLSVALCPLIGADAVKTARVLLRDGHSHPSPNAGPLEAAFAGALGVRLGGRNVYEGRVEDRPVIGEGPSPDQETVVRAARLSQLVGHGAAVVCAAVAWGFRR